MLNKNCRVFIPFNKKKKKKNQNTWVKTINVMVIIQSDGHFKKCFRWSLASPPQKKALEMQLRKIEGVERKYGRNDNPNRVKFQIIN